MQRQRSWVRGHYALGAQARYDTLEGELQLVETILREGWIAPHGTRKLQGLGLTFGDALGQELGLRWVAVEDEYGRDPALEDERTTILLFPLTTISKRVERGETVDVRALFEHACRSVARLRAEHAARKRH